jgi:hypothetical protein
MTKLRISADLALPLDAVTQAIGIVAKRRVGKSYTARRFVEQLVKAGQQVVIADPKGDWWGIRYGADGKSPGLPVTILGGERGDLPLEVGSGEVVAKFVVEERVSVLLDLSLFRKREVARFMADFLETLYRLKAKEALRTPLMLVIDEADAIAPQKPQEGEERMLGAAEDIVRRGGQRGIGCMMITQRTAVLNKNVLTQCEMLIALRTIAPQDLKAMQAWIDVHGSIEERDTLMDSLPSLPQGDAWFWSPGWPTGAGIFQRVHVAPIETFDSGATPKSGERRVEPKKPADIDLGALQRQMAATIEKAKADDPKELRKKIAELEREAKARQAPTTAKPVVDERAIERAVAAAVKPYQQGKERARRDVEKSIGLLRAIITIMEPVAVSLGEDAATAVLNGTADIRDVLRTKAVSVPAPARSITTPQPRAVRAAPADGAALGKTPQRMLNALRFLESVGTSPASRQAVAGLVGISADTGTFRNYLSDLRSPGYITDGPGTDFALTDDGRAQASDEGLPRTTAELHTVWLSKLGGTPQRMLTVLLANYPDTVTRERLAAACGIDHSTGTFRNYLSDLRSPGLIVDVDKATVRAADALFPEGLG